MVINAYEDAWVDLCTCSPNVRLGLTRLFGAVPSPLVFALTAIVPTDIALFGTRI